ncbi:2-C-methyl-D-erythritol 4-phosphate cytidylyltransferase [Pedobacter psychrodurus]|uniref:2-C-methyl-D-erythritol 4-phosphate cytidylyltransferase n=1 Tax=Pedobacter psychrodurus TaxID=2530456 RepID=UPI00292E664A|nr:2-C-methyl-D-erythritol 4-phosphate cytidylyltransferase [Pedobacter psychrodurus]
MKNYIIVLAAGSGSRAMDPMPKQFAVLAGKPVVMHTINAFYDSGISFEIILVLRGDYVAYWHSLCDEYAFKVPHRIVIGGEERFYSVQNALSTLSGEGVVGVHDGVRPFVSGRIIRDTFSLAIKCGNAVPAVSATNTIRFCSDQKNNLALDRKHVYIVQNPQVFELGQLKEAYAQQYDPLFTDDATVAENYGLEINLIEGDRRNIKITHPWDIAIAEGIYHYNLKNEKNILCDSEIPGAKHLLE